MSDMGLPIIDPAELLDRLQPGHTLTAEEIEILGRFRDQPWEHRKRRLDARDAAFLEAVELSAIGDITVAAKHVAKALRHHLAFPLSPPQGGGTEFHEAIKRAAQLNLGKALSWSQIYNTIKGSRYPQKLR